MGADGAEAPDLAHPVHHDGGRADNEKAGTVFLRIQVDHGRNRLYGFSEPHLVAEKDSFLMQDVFDAEELIAAERSAEVLKLHFFCSDFGGQAFRDAAVDELVRGGPAGEIFEKRIVGRAVFFIVREGLAFGNGDRLKERAVKPMETGTFLPGRIRLQLLSCGQRLCFFARAGEEPAEAASDFEAFDKAAKLRVQAVTGPFQVPGGKTRKPVSGKRRDQLMFRRGSRFFRESETLSAGPASRRRP